MQNSRLDSDALKSEIRGDWATMCGGNVARQRIYMRLTPQQVCTFLDIKVQSLWKIERGKIIPKDYLRCGLAFLLSCEVEDLYPPLDRSAIAEFMDVVAA